MDAALLAGFLSHGVRRGPALCATVPRDPEEQQHRGLLHQSLPCVAHSQHPAYILLVRTFFFLFSFFCFLPFWGGALMRSLISIFVSEVNGIGIKSQNKMRFSRQSEAYAARCSPVIVLHIREHKSLF